MNQDIAGELASGQLLSLFSSSPSPLEEGGRAFPQLPPEARDAEAVGFTNNGRLENAVSLPESPDYLIRCGWTSYSSSATFESIIRGMTRLREVYLGEIVIADLSKATGGAYGPHRSHQNGRDVDIWLPHKSGKYRLSPSCRHCGTYFCHAKAEEVDWDATWQLVRALTAWGTDEENPVKEIFLDRKLHDDLRRAIARDENDPATVKRFVQWRKGAPAVVTHSAGHTKHIHVRFKR